VIDILRYVSLRHIFLSFSVTKQTQPIENECVVVVQSCWVA
jgi:hypothetical protein